MLQNYGELQSITTTGGYEEIKWLGLIHFSPDVGPLVFGPSCVLEMPTKE